MNEIGIRAAAAVRKMALEKGLPLWGETELIGTCYSTMAEWEKGRTTPGGVILANMLRRGYDVNYILLGSKNNEN